VVIFLPADANITLIFLDTLKKLNLPLDLYTGSPVKPTAKVCLKPLCMSMGKSCCVSKR
jgi:hypothetical protein